MNRVHSDASSVSIPVEGGEALPEIAVGLRVRLRADRAENWIQPMRDFAKKGREATVTAVGRLIIRTEFDVKRKGARPQVDFTQSPSLFWRDYEPIKDTTHDH